MFFVSYLYSEFYFLHCLTVQLRGQRAGVKEDSPALYLFVPAKGFRNQPIRSHCSSGTVIVHLYQFNTFWAQIEFCEGAEEKFPFDPVESFFCVKGYYKIRKLTCLNTCNLIH